MKAPFTYKSFVLQISFETDSINVEYTQFSKPKASDKQLPPSWIFHPLITNLSIKVLKRKIIKPQTNKLSANGSRIEIVFIPRSLLRSKMVSQIKRLSSDILSQKFFSVWKHCSTSVRGLTNTYALIVRQSSR